MLKTLLEEKQSAIIRRWLADTFATYSSGASGFFQHTQNPFTNPVGNALRKGITGIFECLLTEKPGESIRVYLDDIIKIRAVQDFSPSKAVSFIYLLKQVIREELESDIRKNGLSEELKSFESQLDNLALLSFDIYMNHREKIFELKVNEIKNMTFGLLKRANLIYEIQEEASDSETETVLTQNIKG